jgi:hypothetical protein
MILTKYICFQFSKHQNKDEFRNVDGSPVISSDFPGLRTFAASLQPQQPQWPQGPRQPHFIKKIIDPDGWIIPSTHMIKSSPFLWNESSKIFFFF